MIARARTRQTVDRTRLIAAGVLGITVISVVMWVAVTAQNGLPGRRYHHLQADFANAGNLQTYDDVRIAGHRIGQVSKIALRSHAAHVTLQLDASAPRLRAGTTARIRLDGLIGAKYVDLTPSETGPELSEGATLSSGATSTSPDVFDVLSMFDEPRREDLRTTIRGFGEGFLSRGQDINDAIRDSPELLRLSQTLLGTLNQNPGAARRFFPSLNALSREVAPAREDIANGFEPQTRSIRPFAARRASVEAMLEQAPPTLTVARDELPRVDRLLNATRGLARSVRRLTGPAPRALADAADLLRAAPRPLTRSIDLMHAAQGAIPVALQLTARIAPLSVPLSRLLDSAIPIFDAMGERVCDFEPMTRWLRSAASFGTPPEGEIGQSNVVRILVGATADQLSGTPELPSAAVATNFSPEPCKAAAERIPAG